jgi:metal-responsive CopG/Arc/MetJ family transcriptional regulator
MERRRLQADGGMVANEKTPTNPMKTFTMRLSPRILQWIDTQREEEESRSSVVRRALIAAMKREQELQEGGVGCAD